MTTESHSLCSRCQGCTSSTRLRGRHRRRSHLMYHRRTSPCIHRARRSRTCTNRRGDGCDGWARGSRVRPGGTWRRAQTSGPSQDATLASGAVGLRKFRIAQLLRETARAACAMGHATSAFVFVLFGAFLLTVKRLVFRTKTYSTVLYSTVHSIGTFCTMFSHIGGGRSGISQTTMTRTEGFGYVR